MPRSRTVIHSETRNLDGYIALATGHMSFLCVKLHSLSAKKYNYLWMGGCKIGNYKANRVQCGTGDGSINEQ